MYVIHTKENKKYGRKKNKIEGRGREGTFNLKCSLLTTAGYCKHSLNHLIHGWFLNFAILATVIYIHPGTFNSFQLKYEEQYPQGAASKSNVLETFDNI